MAVTEQIDCGTTNPHPISAGFALIIEELEAVFLISQPECVSVRQYFCFRDVSPSYFNIVFSE